MPTEQTELIARAIIRRGAEILVANQRGTAWLFLPGGHVEPGEPVETALIREIAEELGVTSTITSFAGLVEHGYTSESAVHHEINVVFEVALDPTAQPASQEEHLEFHWIPLHDLAHADVRPVAVKALATQDPDAPVWRGWTR